MSKVVFFLILSHGHTIPTIPVVSELVKGNKPKHLAKAADVILAKIFKGGIIW